MTGTTAIFSSTAAENNWTFVPQSWKYDQSKRGLVYCHGAGQDASAGAGLASIAAASGMVSCFPDLSGTPGTNNAWGNDSMLAKIAAQWSVLKSQYNVKPDKMVIAGLSMGTAAALLALLNPGSVAGVGVANIAAVYLELPAVSMNDIHDNDRLSQAAPIETAYGGLAAWNAAKAARDPLTNVAAFNALGVPMLIQYGGADSVCLPQFSRQFIAGVSGCESVNMGDTVVHDVTFVDVQRRTAFLLRNAK